MANTTLPETSSNLLTRAQAAEYLGLKEQTLAVWAATGRHNLTFVKIGGRVRYLRADLDAWIESRASTSVSRFKSALAV
jgi:excisionase family DNA binding protein